MQSVLLDFDGTLTDSRAGILASYAAALRSLGHEPDPAVDLSHLIGPPIRDVIGPVLAHYGDDRADAAVAAYRAHYRSTGMLDSTLYEGVGALLRALRDNGRRLYLATAKRTDISRDMLARFGLLGMFAGVYRSEPGGALDHKPELIGHILAQEGIDPAEAVMVGDRRYDIAGAHANGVRAVGALWGYGGREELEAAGADALAEDPGALAETLLGPGPRVRAATADDLGGVLRLYRAFRSYDEGFDAAAARPCWDAMERSGATTVLVAETDGGLAATCSLTVAPNLTWSGRPYGVIENVATDPPVRREGLGLRVLAAAQARAWDAGCYKVSVASGSVDEGVLRFYERAGFARGRRRCSRCGGADRGSAAAGDRGRRGAASRREVERSDAGGRGRPGVTGPGRDAYGAESVSVVGGGGVAA